MRISGATANVTLRSWWGWGLVAAAVVAAAGWGASAPEPGLPEGVLLVAPHRVVKLSPEGAILSSWSVDDEILAAAADRRRGTVWLLSADGLAAHTADGSPGLRLPLLSSKPRGAPPSAFLALRPKDGAAWAALGSRVVNVGTGGQRLGSFEAGAPVVGLLLDASRDVLWVATETHVEARDAVSGELVHRLSLETSEPVRGISLGLRGRLWVNLPSQALRFEADGSLRKAFPLQGARVLAADGTGGAWATDGARLFRFGPGWLKSWPLGELEDAQSLTTDWARGGVWVSDGQRALWLSLEGQQGEVLGLDVAAEGAISAVLVVPGPYLMEAHPRTSAVAGHLHLSPPEIEVTAPAAYVLVNEATPEVRVSFAATDRPLDLASLVVEVDGTDRTSACSVDEAAGEATCPSAETLSGGPHTVTARIADDEGSSATAEAGFHLLFGRGRHEVALPAAADSFLRVLLPNRNEGDADFLQVRWLGLNRALVRFGLEEISPWIETLVSAHLELTLLNNANNWGPAGRPVSVHRIEEPWTEEGVTWRCAVDENPKNFRTDCPERWNGGTYSSTPTASLLHENGLEGSVSWDVTADLQAYLQGAEGNHGWLVRREQELWPGWVRYGSREGAFAQAPRLVLIFDGGESQDRTPPDLSITSPAAGSIVRTSTPELGFSYSDDLSGVNPDSLTATVGGSTLGLSCAHAPTGATCSFSSSLADGEATVTATLADLAGNVSAPASVTFTVDTSPLPPDPATVAPPLDRTVVTDLFTSTEFLYTGPNPIQTGVAPGTIERRRVSVLRGRVLDRSGAPLPGITITVLDHPELGSTLSRLDGMFDLAVNGGGLITLNYEKQGYLPSQRQQTTPWRDYRWFEDVVLIPYDNTTTTIVADSSGTQVARGTPQTDADGTRQATLLFPAGTTAEMELEDGTVQALTTLTLRATEYTVGESGPDSMPGPLPPTVAYTYAVELSADEAEAAGAIEVRFNQPTYLYVENFIGFPVGEPVPLGSWDRRQAAWIGSPNGRVIKILGADPAGLAEVDVNGSGTPADAATLEELGFTDGERLRLAELYPAGAELWRSPIPHLTPWDCNWPWAPPDDAELPPDDDPFLPGERHDPGDPNDPNAPDNPNNPDAAPDPDDPDAMPDPEDPADDEPPLDDDCEQQGSVMECLNQVLGQSVGLTGAPHRLHYRSDRQRGFGAAYSLRVAVSGDAVPASLKEIRLRVEVAGSVVSDTSYPPQPNQRVSFTWNGQDSYERTVQGQIPVTVKKTYVYNLRYTPATRDFNTSWARFPESSVSLGPPRLVGGTTRLSRVYRGSLEGNGITHLGTWDAREQGLGGWSLDVHHVYDPTAQVLYPGSGRRRTAREIGPVVTRYAGIGTIGNTGDGGPAREAELAAPSGIALAADGSLFVADTDNHVVRKISPEGVITTVAGTGEACIIDTCTEPDGNCGDNDGLRIAPGAMLPGGPGGGLPGGDPEPVCGNGGLATAALLNAPEDVAVGPDGSLYIADTGIGCVRRVDLAGVIEPAAGRCAPPVSTGGGGSQGLTAEEGLQTGDGLAAISVAFEEPFEVELTPDGSLFVAERGVGRVSYIGTDGSFGVVAGGGTTSATNGARARDVRLNGLAGLALGPDGTLYLSQATLGTHGIWSVSIDGRLSLVAGAAAAGFDGDGGLAIDALLDSPGRLVAVADGSLYVSDRGNRRIRKIDAAGVIFTVAGNGDDEISSFMAPATGSPLRRIDGLLVAPDSELYLADSRQNIILRAGLALQGFSEENILIAAESGGEVYVFDPQGRHQRTVHALTGADLYTFDYDPNGRLSVVTDRSDRRTEIQRDGSGNPTSIVGPYGQATQLVTDPQGFLQRVVDEAGGATAFAYSNGLLVRQIDPRGFATEWDYTLLGRLGRERSPDGGVQEFRRYGQADNPEYFVVRRDGEDIPTLYRTKRHRGGLRERIVSDREELAERYYSRSSGLKTERDPDGTFTQVQASADSRFGMQASQPSLSLRKLPSGLTQSSRLREESIVSDPNDPLSLERMERTYSLNGRVHGSVFDAQSRTFTLTSPEGRTTSIRVDPQGRILEQTIPGLEAASFEYRPDGRRTASHLGSGAGRRTYSMTYNTAGLQETAQNPLGHLLSLSYDEANRLTKQTFPDGQEILFEYDAAGNRTSLKPPGRAPHEMTFSAVNQVTSSRDSAGGALSYAYLSNRKLRQIERPGGELVMFDYDALGRLSRFSQARGQTLLDYDPATGNLVGVQAPDGGRVLQHFDGPFPTRTEWIGEVSGFIEQAYDSDFRLRTQRVNGVAEIGYHYDGDSLLIQAGNLALSYDPGNGLPQGTALGSVVTSRTYSGFAELAEMRAEHSGSELYSAAFVRDSLGRISQKVETIQGETHTFEYSYDLRGRLKVVLRDGLQWEAYTYDTNSNRLSVTSLQGVHNATYDGRDRLLTHGDQSFEYTAAGELRRKTQGDASVEYMYDELGNLLSATLDTGTVVEYLVDAQGRRIGKKIDGELTQGFLWAGPLSPAAELDGTGAIASRFVYATRQNVPDYLERNGQTYRLVLDHLGSVRLVVNTATGEIVQRLDYDSFGQVQLDTNPGFQPFGFAGGLYDHQTHLVRFGVRDYDPEVGRWTAPDPSGFVGRDTNLYAYVFNDPVNLIDPEGLDAVTSDTGLQDCFYCLYAGAGFGRSPHEDAAWVVKNGADLECVFWPTTRERRTTSTNSKPANAIAIAHTHPRDVSEKPSRTGKKNDQKTAREQGMPVYVIHPKGIYKFDPDSGETTQEEPSNWFKEPKNKCKEEGRKPCEGIK